MRKTLAQSLPARDLLTQYMDQLYCGWKDPCDDTALQLDPGSRNVLACALG